MIRSRVKDCQAKRGGSAPARGAGSVSVCDARHGVSTGSDSDRVDARSEQRRTNERPVPHRSRLYPVAIAPGTDSITQTKTLSASDTLMQSKAERC